MLGAIIGDIVGSRFEWHNIKSKDFDMFTSRCHVTDDSVMTLAVATVTRWRQLQVQWQRHIMACRRSSVR